MHHFAKPAKGLKKLAGVEHSSLFFLVVSNKEAK
jgi:hypothetical protein